MSRAAQDWAARLTGLDAGVRWTLWHLADGAGGSGQDDGEAAFYSITTIAKRTGTSRESVKRHLRQLEKLGYIERGDDKHVSHYPANRRPAVWNLRLWITGIHGGSSTTPQTSPGGSPASDSGGSPMTPNPRTNYTLDNSLNETKPQTARDDAGPVDNSEADERDPAVIPCPHPDSGALTAARCPLCRHAARKRSTPAVQPCPHGEPRGPTRCPLCRRVPAWRPLAVTSAP